MEREEFGKIVQQLHWAMKHICNNDTSGEIRSIRMTVQDRCGQRNELPPVVQFYLLLNR